MAFRMDLYDITSKFTKTPEGYLIGTANATSIGVFRYMNMDGSYRLELRHPDDVFNYDSMMSLTNKPITNEHPKEGFVNSTNVDELGVGMTGSFPDRNELYLGVPITITHADAVDDVQNGKRELSCGYNCDLEPAEPGSTFLGMPYTHRQTNIRYNHVAIVPKGRAGSDASIRMDSMPVKGDFSDKEGKVMADLKTVNLDSVDYQAEAKVIETLHGHKTRADQLDAALTTAKSDLSKVTGERDHAKERVDALEKELADLKASHLDSAKVQELVKVRVDLESTAKSVGVEVTDSQSNIDLMSAVIKAKFPKDNLDGKDEVYIQARYDSVKEVLVNDAEGDAASRQLAGEGSGNQGDQRTDAADPEAARKRYLARLHGKKE